MKALLAGAAALALSPAAAFAGPYLNIESNSSFAGSDYAATVIDNHIGFEGNGWYLQGGPAIVSGDGVDAEVELSGKAGGSVALSEATSIYGEVSFLTGDDEASYGTKVGVTHKF